jgi:hypothetical protein
VKEKIFTVSSIVIFNRLYDLNRYETLNNELIHVSWEIHLVFNLLARYIYWRHGLDGCLLAFALLGGLAGVDLDGCYSQIAVLWHLFGWDRMGRVLTFHCCT